MARPMVMTGEVVEEPSVMTAVLTFMIGVDAAKKDRAGMRLDEEPALPCAGVNAAADGGDQRFWAETRSGNRSRSECEHDCGN